MKPNGMITYRNVQVIGLYVVEIEVNMTNKQRNYSKYLIIFVDVLGSQNKTDFQESYLINTVFHEEFQSQLKNDMPHTAYQRKVFTFSDCAYIFYQFKEDIEEERKDIGALFKVALCNCEPIFLRLLKEKILFRGGVYYGDAYVDSERNMFFGPAVVEAYKLESKVAVHPRILIDSFVAEKIHESVQKAIDAFLQNSPQANLLPIIGESSFGRGVVEKDIDEKYILNYLHYPENNIVLQGCYFSSIDFLNEIIDYCQSQIKTINDYRVIDKLYYLLRFTESKLSHLV